MISFCVYQKNSGKILKVGICQESDLLIQVDDELNDLLELIENNINDSTHYIDNGTVTIKPTKPSENHVFDYTLKDWVDPRTIEDLKAIKNDSINTSRLQANQSSFTYAGHQISCDALSRSDIDGVNGIVALTGNLPVDWVGFWKVADNAYISIPDVATWSNLYAAMVAQGQTNFVYSQELKAQLALATTAEEINTITWV